MNKRDLLNIFRNIKQDDPKPTGQHFNSRILLIDGMNTFIRSFAAINHHNLAGNHVGGLTGFLKSIGSAIKLLKPTRVLIVFDGEGGSVNRKYLYPQYKANRNNQRLVNYKSFNTIQEEKESKEKEIVRLTDYLKLLPLNSISIDKLEADDIIGYLTTKFYKEYDDCNIFIMSSDKDFLQLVNDRVSVYSPTKKKTYSVNEVIEEFGVHPENFVIYKALVGDSSDNIPGVSGVGEKNISTLFESLKEPRRMQLVDIYEICKEPPKKSVIYPRILNTMKMVEVFYQLVNIREPNISNADKEDIHRKLNNQIPRLKKYEFIKQYHTDRLGDTIPGVANWVNLFSILNI